MAKEFMLSFPLKKILKVIHILTLTGITGGLLSILALLLVKQGVPDSTNLFPIDLCMLKIFMHVVTISSFVLIGTSAVYELFTEWGIFKHYWIMAKWVIVLLMFAVTWMGLGPAISGMTSLSDAGFHTGTMKDQYQLFGQKVLVFVIIELLMVVLAGNISVFKPWGKRTEKKPINRKKVLIILVPILLLSLSMPIMQSASLNKIRSMSIENSNLTGIKDGVYYGEAEVGNYPYKVNVEIKDGTITRIESVDPRKSPYVTYAEGVFNKVIRDQNANTDAITGATTTSKAYMKAVENAITNARKQ